MIGITGKAFQNVLRGQQEGLAEYIKDFEKAIADSAQHCREQYGEYSMNINFTFEGQPISVPLNWEGITRLTTAIGSQTLTLRGSDKSMYGKLFERLVLGSILTILGFKRVHRETNKETSGIFWLSDSSDNRESDATLIVSPGRVVRFDIGFIGSGNSEISKDKLSRFAKDIEVSGETAQSVTFIIIDRLPETGKTKQAAEKIGAEIIQMSMAYWPLELATKLANRFDITFEMLHVKHEEFNKYIKAKIADIPVQDFLSNVTLDEVAESIEKEEENLDSYTDED